MLWEAACFVDRWGWCLYVEPKNIPEVHWVITESLRACLIVLNTFVCVIDGEYVYISIPCLHLFCFDPQCESLVLLIDSD